MTYQELCFLFALCPETGRLFHNPNRPSHMFSGPQGEKVWRGRFAGKQAGSLAPDGYHRVMTSAPKYGSRSLLLHRVVFAMSRKVGLPASSTLIDHINGNKLDNRPSNLRTVTFVQNSQNSVHPVGSTGFRGVTTQKNSPRFRALIRNNGKQTCLGCFDTPEQAHAAYVAAAEKTERTIRHIKG